MPEKAPGEQREQNPEFTFGEVSALPLPLSLLPFLLTLSKVGQVTYFGDFSAAYQLFQWDEDPASTSANCSAMHALCLTYERCSRVTAIAPEIIICIFLFVHLSVFPWPSSRNWNFLSHTPFMWHSGFTMASSTECPSEGGNMALTWTML